MNKKILVALSLIATGCTSTPTFQTGEDAELTYDGLTRMQGTIMDVVWARTDIDLTAYSKIMFNNVGIEYREVSGPASGRGGTTTTMRMNQTEFRLDEATRELFEAEITGAFREEMATSEVFEIVEEAGPDVLLIVGGLLDVVSRVPPERVGRSRVFLDSVGEATLILEIRGSMSNSIYARAADRRAAAASGPMRESNRATNRAEVRRLGRRWAGILRAGLETLMTDGLKQ